MFRTVINKTSTAVITSKATSSAIRSSSSAATVTSSMIAESTDFFNQLSSETEKELTQNNNNNSTDDKVTNHLEGMISRNSNNISAVGNAVVDEDALLQDFFVNMIDSETRSSLPPPNTTFMRAAAAAAASSDKNEGNYLHHRRGGIKAQEKAEARRSRSEDRTKFKVKIPGMEAITFDPNDAQKTGANLFAALNNNKNSSNAVSNIIEKNEPIQEVKTAEITTVLAENKEVNHEATSQITVVESPAVEKEVHALTLAAGVVPQSSITVVVDTPQTLQLEKQEEKQLVVPSRESDEETVHQVLQERSTSPEIQIVVIDDLESAAMLEHQTLDANEGREDSTLRSAENNSQPNGERETTTTSLQQRLVEEDELLLEKRSASQDRRDEEAATLHDQEEVEHVTMSTSAALTTSVLDQVENKIEAATVEEVSLLESPSSAVLQQQHQEQPDEPVAIAPSGLAQQESIVHEVSAASEIEVKSEETQQTQQHEKVEIIASSETFIDEALLEKQDELSSDNKNTSKETQQQENNNNNDLDDFYLFEEQPQVDMKHEEEIKNVQRLTNEEEAHDLEISDKESVLDSLQRSLEFFTLATKTTTTTTATSEYDNQQVLLSPDQQASLSAATIAHQKSSSRTPAAVAASRKPLTQKEEQQLFSRIPITKREIQSQISRQTTFYMKRASTSLLSRLKEADKLLKGLRKEKLLLSQQRTKMRNILNGLEKQVEKLEQRAVRQQKMLAEITAQIKQNRLLKVMQTCAKTKKITADVLNDRLLPSAHFVDLVAERIAERHHIPEIFGGSNTLNATILLEQEAQNQMIDDKNDHEELELISSVTKRQEKLQQQIEDQLKELQKTLSEAENSSNNVDADNNNNTAVDDADADEVLEDYSSSISDASDVMMLQEQKTLASHVSKQPSYKITNEDVFIQVMDDKISSYHLEELIDRGIASYQADTGLISEDDNDDIDEDQVEKKIAEQQQQQVSVTKSKVRMPDIVFIPTMSRKTVVAQAASPTF